MAMLGQIAESGAAWHDQAVDNTASTTKSIVDFQRAWWQDCITSPSLFTQFPRLKLTMHFEHQKVEEDRGQSDLRDYRYVPHLSKAWSGSSLDRLPLKILLRVYLVPWIDDSLTNDTSMLAAFQADMQPVLANYVIASSRERPVGIPANGRPTAVPGAPQAKPTYGIVFQTARVPVVTGVSLGSSLFPKLGPTH